MLNTAQKKKIVNLGIILIAFVLSFEILFYHQTILDWLGNLVRTSGVWGWVVVGILQYVQVVLIPIPSYFITLTSMQMYPDHMILLFCITLGAVMLGCVTAYWVGRLVGKKAVIWAAGSEAEYDKWLSVLRSKKTNIFYFLTILFPIFPDDVLCILVGSMKMNFWWFFGCNLVGRAIGLVTFMFVFKSLGNDLVTIIIFAIILLLLIIYRIYLKYKKERKNMNILVIGENTDPIAMDIWRGNTNYMVLNQSPYVWGKDFLKFIKNKEVIVSTKSDQFESKDINEFVDWCKKHEFVPIFIADEGVHNFVDTMYVAVNELLPNSILYARNKEQKDYQMFLKLCRKYLLGKGIIENDNKPVRTSEEGEGTVTEE